MSGWITAYLDAWNSHDGAQVTAFMADDVAYEDLALGVVRFGREAVADFVRETREFASDYRFTPVSQQQDGNRFAIEWVFSGTNTGTGSGLPATGMPFQIRGASVGEVDPDGRIASIRDYWNIADYLVQVGILTPPS